MMNDVFCVLGADESPAFDLVNPAGDAPLLITCDHASHVVPRSLDGLGIDPELLGLHIAYDIGARQVAMLLSEQFNAPLLLANYSRLVVDLNRYPDDVQSMPVVSDGHVIVGNQGLSDGARQARLDALFWPYHAMHAELVQKLKARHAKPIILSVHSFTESMQGVDRPWHFGVLWDQQESFARALLDNFEAQAGAHDPVLVIGDNEPYHARRPAGYSMFEHAEDQGVNMALVEIRQDLIAGAPGQQWAADILYRALLPLIANVD